MVSLGGEKINIASYKKVVLQDAPVSLDEGALGEVQRCFIFLKDFSAGGKLIYGINTGFGPMAQYRIDDADRRQLQYNLVRSHSSGMGKTLSPIYTRGLMVARLNTLLLGYSGIHPDTLTLLAALINNGAYPCIYEHGGVGASGDLVQLAHLAQGMMAEGDFLYKGKEAAAGSVFEALQLAPMQIYVREGLAVLNGTSAMTGIAGVNVLLAHRLAVWATLLGVMVNEVAEAYDDSFSEGLNKVKLHAGQNKIAGWMRAMAGGSTLLKNRNRHLYDKKITDDVIDEKVQEYYSLRCVPQILGPVADTIAYACTVVENELNSVNDNPVVDYKNENIYHGGNFHGDYIALEMDKLKLAVTKLGMLAERQLNYLLNPNLNQKLPPFLNGGKLGLNFGLQGMQYPATSTVAENQALSTSQYIHSIPNNNDNQDIVSMGCNAAVVCGQVIDNTYDVLAVETAALVQAISLLGIAARLSDAGKWLYGQASNIFPPFRDDVTPSARLRALKQWMAQTDVEARFDMEIKTVHTDAK